MVKKAGPLEFAITVHEEDGSSHDVHLPQAVYEPLLAAWKLSELQCGRPLSFSDFIKQTAEKVLAERRSVAE